MVLATPAMAQTGTLTLVGGTNIRDNGATFNINPTLKWNATYKAWRVNYSVDINMAYAESLAMDIHGNEALAELKAVKAKYTNRYWFQMRYANTYVNNAQRCMTENPAAYNHELIGGTGWYRSFWVKPGEKTCLTVWIYGDNLYSSKGNKWQTARNALGSAYFVAPAAPPP